MNDERRALLFQAMSSLDEATKVIEGVKNEEVKSNGERPRNLQAAEHGLMSDAAIYFLKEAMATNRRTHAFALMAMHHCADWFHSIYADLTISFLVLRGERELKPGERLPAVIISSDEDLSLLACEGPRGMGELAGAFGIIYPGLAADDFRDLSLIGTQVRYKFKTQKSFLRLVNYRYELENEYEEAIVLDEISAGDVEYSGDDRYRDLLDDMMISAIGTRMALEDLQKETRRPKLELVK